MDAITQFEEAIITHGLNPGTIIPDGKIHRFSTNGKPSDKGGWYICFADSSAGAFGDLRKDVKYTWSAKNGNKFDDAERAEFKKRMEKVEKERRTQQKRLRN